MHPNLKHKEKRNLPYPLRGARRRRRRRWWWGERRAQRQAQLNGKERRMQRTEEKMLNQKETTRAAKSAQETQINAAYKSTRRSQKRGNTTTTQHKRRRTHRSNRTEAKAATIRAKDHERDGPLTWCSLYCTASLLIQTIFMIRWIVRVIRIRRLAGHCSGACCFVPGSSGWIPRALQCDRGCRGPWSGGGGGGSSTSPPGPWLCLLEGLPHQRDDLSRFLFLLVSAQVPTRGLNWRKG